MKSFTDPILRGNLMECQVGDYVTGRFFAGEITEVFEDVYHGDLVIRKYRIRNGKKLLVIYPDEIFTAHYEGE